MKAEGNNGDGVMRGENGEIVENVEKKTMHFEL